MNGCVILHISCSIFSNGGKRGSIFCNEWVYDLGTSAVPYLVIGARGVPYFVINGHAILTHKGSNIYQQNKTGSAFSKLFR